MNFEKDDVRFLADLTRDVVEASRVRPGQQVVAGYPENATYPMATTTRIPARSRNAPARSMRAESMSAAP